MSSKQRAAASRDCRYDSVVTTTTFFFRRWILIAAAVVTVSSLLPTPPSFAAVHGFSASPPPPSSAATATASATSQRILSLIGSKLDSPPSDPAVKEEMSVLLRQLYSEQGDDAAGAENSNNVLFEIGRSVYGVNVVPAPETKKKPDAAAATDADSAEEKDAVIVDFEYMKRFMVDVFDTYGVPADRCETAAEVLVEADRRGIHSHGLGRLKPIYCDRMDAGILLPSRPIDVVAESDATALLDGNLGLGLYIGPAAMQLAIDKAKKHGIGFVAVQNSTHYGIAGYYATMATEQGCVGWTGTNARPSIPPTHGVQPMMGTNPLCYGIPTDEPFDFVIDCATSINQRGKIEMYDREGLPTPKGVVIDNDGVERTDTAGILRDLVLGKAALTAMGGAGEELGGYKGYSWAAVVELLSIAFQSGPFGEAISGRDPATGAPKSMPLGHYFMAIDIEKLVPVDTFRKNAGELLRALRGSKKSPTGPGRIWTAGEKEHDARLKQAARGGMTVSVPLQRVMSELRDNRPGLKDKYPKLPFE